jgi:hypothetical protein
MQRVNDQKLPGSNFVVYGMSYNRYQIVRRADRLWHGRHSSLKVCFLSGLQYGNPDRQRFHVCQLAGKQLRNDRRKWISNPVDCGTAHNRYQIVPCEHHLSRDRKHSLEVYL